MQIPYIHKIKTALKISVIFGKKLTFLFCFPGAQVYHKLLVLHGKSTEIQSFRYAVALTMVWYRVTESPKILAFTSNKLLKKFFFMGYTCIPGIQSRVNFQLCPETFCELNVHNSCLTSFFSCLYWKKNSMWLMLSMASMMSYDNWYHQAVWP